MNPFFGGQKGTVESQFTRYDNDNAYGIEFNGNETVVTIIVQGITGVGSSKCNPIDVYSRDLGEAIASARALTEISKQFEELWVSRAVTKEDYRKRHPNKSV